MAARRIKAPRVDARPPCEASVGQSTARRAPGDAPQRRHRDEVSGWRDLPAAGDSGHAHLPTADCLLLPHDAGNGLTACMRVRPFHGEPHGGKHLVYPRVLGSSDDRRRGSLRAGSGQREPRTHRGRRCVRMGEREASDEHSPDTGGALGWHGLPRGSGGPGSRTVRAREVVLHVEDERVERGIPPRATRSRQGEPQRGHEEPRPAGPRASPSSVDFTSHA